MGTLFELYAVVLPFALYLSSSLLSIRATCVRGMWSKCQISLDISLPVVYDTYLTNNLKSYWRIADTKQ